MTCSTVRLVVSFHTSVCLSFDLTTSFANFTGMDVKSETSSKDTISSSLAILWQSGNLSEDGYNRLRVPDPNPASIYGLPKVHKVELRQSNDYYAVPAEALGRIPLRPILVHQHTKYPSTWLEY